jgi:superfamily II DNA or RNA helicase
MAAWPSAKVLGVTATPARNDGKGLADCFDKMVIGPEMADLISAGFLASYTYLAPPQMVDLSSVKTKMGDFAVDQLADAMDKAVITGDAIGHYRTHLAGRPAIVFSVTVAHAESVAAQFRAAGFRAASVDGKMTAEDRRGRIASIGDGRLQILTSCELISEGTDIPAVAGAILLRPTKSLGLYLQQVGRSLRPKGDGSGAVILDHVGNVHRHGMPDASRDWSLDSAKRKTDAPGISTCEQCFRAFQVKPDWRADETCAEGQPEGCILAPVEKEAAAKAKLEVVAGDLEVVTNTPHWSDGLNLVTARGPDFEELLGLADTPEKLKEIARARGFKHGWVRHVMASRHRRAA